MVQLYTEKKQGMNIFQSYICMEECVHSQTISSNREGFHGKGVVDKFQKVLLQCSNKVQRDSCVQVIDTINTNRKFEVTTGKQYKNRVCFL